MVQRMSALIKHAIFTYPRTGSTLLQKVIMNHLHFEYGWDYSRNLGEVFNPVENRCLTESDGCLVEHESPGLQSRTERLRLMQEHAHQSYLIKVFAQDAVHPGVLKFIKDNYLLIVLERRDPLDAFLSGLIAYHFQLWHYEGNEPQYESFKMPEEEARKIARYIALYYHIKTQLQPNIVATLVYEDIVKMTRKELLQAVGFETFSYNDNRPLPYKKLLTFEEKTHLIENIHQMREIYQLQVVPFLPIVFRHEK